MKKSKKYINLGIVMNGISIVLNRFESVPEFISGMCISLGLCLLFLGYYDQNHDTAKLLRYKKNIKDKFFNNIKKA